MSRGDRRGWDRHPPGLLQYRECDEEIMGLPGESDESLLTRLESPASRGRYCIVSEGGKRIFLQPDPPPSIISRHIESF